MQIVPLGSSSEVQILKERIVILERITLHLIFSGILNFYEPNVRFVL